VLVSGTVVGALQDGPLSGLYTYGMIAGGGTKPSATARSVGEVRAAPSIALLRQDPGTIQTLVVAGRTSLVDVPGTSVADPSPRVPFVYFLHGTPGNPGQWLGIATAPLLENPPGLAPSPR
jgi:hypothetical protein